MTWCSNSTPDELKCSDGSPTVKAPPELDVPPTGDDTPETRAYRAGYIDGSREPLRVLRELVEHIDAACVVDCKDFEEFLDNANCAIEQAESISARYAVRLRSMGGE